MLRDDLHNLPLSVQGRWYKYRMACLRDHDLWACLDKASSLLLNIDPTLAEKLEAHADDVAEAEADTHWEWFCEDMGIGYKP